MLCCSTAASERMEGRRRWDDRDAARRAIGEGRGPAFRAQAFYLPISALAAGVHNHHEHGPAVVRSERRKLCHTDHKPLGAQFFPVTSLLFLFGLIPSFTEIESRVYPQIYYYADSIFSSAGVKANDVQYVTVGTGAVNVLMTFAAVSVQTHYDQAVPHNSIFMSLFRYFTGVYSGSLWQEAAASDWVRDLLHSLCDPHCSSQPAGMAHNTSLPV